MFEESKRIHAFIIATTHRNSSLHGRQVSDPCPYRAWMQFLCTVHCPLAADMLFKFIQKFLGHVVVKVDAGVQICNDFDVINQSAVVTFFSKLP